MKPLTLGVLLALGFVAAGRDFYLAPDGEDGGPGTRRQPWQTIAKANAELKPGDRAIFLPGNYSGTISPQRSGRKDQPIGYIAEKPGTVKIEGTVNPLFGEKLIIGIKDRENLVIDGFANSGEDAKWLRIEKVHDSIFRNLDFNGTNYHSPIECRDSNRNRFINISAMRTLACKDGMIWNDMWNNFNCSGNVYQKLYISRAGHRPFGIWYDCSNNIIRDSIFDARWGRPFELFAPSRMLMERCIITNAFHSTASAVSMAKLFMIDSIFRRNVIFRNGAAPLEARAYQYRDETTVLPPFGLRGSRIYFNTFFHNLDAAFILADRLTPNLPELTLNNEIKNNIFAAKTPGGEGTALRILEALPTSNRIHHNILFGNRKNDNTVRIYNAQGATTGIYTTAAIEQKWPEIFFANLDDDPGFTAPEANDLTLRPGSPAIDAGEALTLTTAAGNGRELPVRDARYFFDGFGIEGENGDTIVIGNNRTPARVIRVDLEKNRLLLDRDVAFELGATVNLPYQGNAPDLGACETGMATAPAIPSGLEMPLSPATLLLCDFESAHRENYFYLFGNTYMPYSEYNIDNTTAASGKQSLRVSASANTPAGGGSVLCVFLPVTFWQIDRHPLVSFAYRIPRNVPVGVTLVFFDDAALNTNEICLGGSPAMRPQSGVGNAGLLELRDDDQWHVAEIDLRKVRPFVPAVNMIKQWRFITGGNGSKGDQYWIDDFKIQGKEPEK